MIFGLYDYQFIAIVLGIFMGGLGLIVCGCLLYETIKKPNQEKSASELLSKQQKVKSVE